MTPPVFAHGHLRLYLLALLNEQPRHGYELIQALSDRFDGTYAPSAGTIYPRLAKLEAEGLVTKEVDGRKTIYRITEAGRREVEARRGELDEIEQGVDSSVQRLARELRESLGTARDRLRTEFDDLRARSTGDAGPTWGSDFGQKASEFAQRAADAANAGWSAAETRRAAGGEFGDQVSEGFKVARGLFAQGADAGRSDGAAAGGADARGADASGPDAHGPGAHGPDARGGGNEPRAQGAPTSPAGTTGTGVDEPGPADASAGTGDARRASSADAVDSRLARRADLALDRFRQELRQDLRRAEAEGHVSEEIVGLLDVELARVRDLVRSAIAPRG